MLRSNRVWLVALILALGLWVGCVPQAAGQGTKGRDKVEKLSPAERAWLEKEFKALRDLPPGERQRLREAWRRASPEERQRLLEDLRHRRETGTGTGTERPTLGEPR